MNQVLEMLRIPAALVLALLAWVVAIGAWKLLRTPRHILREHNLLREAVHCMNKGTATSEQRERMKDAEKLGMVNAGFYVDRQGCMVIRYYLTRWAHEYWWDGEYPTTASLNAELEEFRIA